MCCGDLYRCVFCLVFLISQFVAVDYTSKIIQRHKHDLAQKDDLKDYVEALNSVVNYYDEHKDEIQVNDLFGLFLMNVNLRYSLKIKANSLPKAIRDIIENSEKLRAYFFTRLKIEPHIAPAVYKQISTLFANTTYWINRMRKFQNTAKRVRSFKELRQMFPNWSKYAKDVADVNLWTPNPEVSDICLVSLSKNGYNKKQRLGWCPVKKECYQMLQKGTNFGYALCHRMLLLVLAHLGRGCNILTPAKDKEMLLKFCSLAYTEVEYIAMNDFKLPDLMFEFLFLCTSVGDASFLKREWLDQMLNFQTTDGCFGQNKAALETEQTRIHRPAYAQNSNCDGHVTALAAAVLSSAVKFIAEIYY